MIDFLYVLGTVTFFALMGKFTTLCDWREHG